MDANTEVESMGKAVSEGQSLRAVACNAGVSPTTVLRRLLRHGDKYQRRRHRPIVQSERVLIAKLARDGEVSVRRIAIMIGRPKSWHSVKRIIEAEGLPRIATRHRCERCGTMIVLQPCVVCAALAARDVASAATS